MKTLKDYLHKSEGFTLIELLITIVIIGVIASLAILNIFGLADRATDSVIIANMRTLSSEMEAYAANNDGYPGENTNDFSTENFIGQYKNEFNGLNKIVDELGDYSSDNNLYFYEIDGSNYVFSVNVNDIFIRISKPNGLETEENEHLSLDEL